MSTNNVQEKAPRLERRRRRNRRERGAAAVEFALITPLLFTLILGIISFGQGYSTKIALTSGVREGARTLALGGTNADATARVIEAAPGLNPALAASNVTILETCPAGSTTAKARVQAEYNVPYNLLFTSGTWNLTVVGVMRCGL